MFLENQNNPALVAFDFGCCGVRDATRLNAL